MNADFIEAIGELEKEKGIDKNKLVDAVKQAIVTAFKKDYAEYKNIKVEIDDITGALRVIAEIEVVEEVTDEFSEISLEAAREINMAYEVGDFIHKDITPKTFGRIAAQTAKQVIIQQIREEEKNVIRDRYIEKENEMLTATVERQERGTYYLDLGNAECIIPARETIPGETLETNQKVKVYVLEVKDSSAKGTQIITSRSHPSLVKRLFELEVPEIAQNIVVIKALAREAGKRSKIAVYAEDSNVDAVGACVGSRGSRINAVVDELNGERIDIIPWSENDAEFIANALRPADVLMTRLNEDEKTAEAIVPDNQLSLAIGKEGQNVRLAAKLTGYKIDIKTKSKMTEDFQLDAE